MVWAEGGCSACFAARGHAAFRAAPNWDCDVAVHSDADKHAPHVDMADEAVRMQGWLAAASALSLALATFACGRLTRLFGDRTHLAMAGRTMAGLVLALFAAALKRRIET
jgi:MFS family permease